MIPSLVLLMDTETSGTDDGAVCLEVACTIYSLRHASPVRSFASLIRAESNPAEPVNRISPALLLEAPEPAPVWARVREMVGKVDAIVAHNASFDRRFVPHEVAGATPWVCSMEDLLWPRARKPAGEGLVALALAHDLGVASAHRAGADVDLLARLFTRAAELGADLGAMLVRGLRPKALFIVADRGFDAARNELAKLAGFTWDNLVPKAWGRRMVPEDTATLPFQVREVADG